MQYLITHWYLNKPETVLIDNLCPDAPKSVTEAIQWWENNYGLRNFPLLNVFEVDDSFNLDEENE